MVWWNAIMILEGKLKRLALAALFVAAALNGAMPAANDSGPMEEGVITEVSGQAVVLNRRGNSRPARPGEVVAGGEIIETKADGRVKITLVDRSFLEVRPNSRVQINDSRLNPRGVSSVLVYVGWIWAKVTARAVTDYAFEVEAATAVAGVRGTELEVAVAEDGSTRVGVREGRAVMENEAGSLRLSQGQTGEAGYERAPEAKGSYSAQAEFWLSWLNQHHLALFSDLEVFVIRMVAAVLDARQELIERDGEFREAWEEFQEQHPAAEKPGAKEEAEPAVEPGMEREKEEKEEPGERAEVATEVHQLYRKARQAQKESHRMESNYYLAEQARNAAAGSPEKFKPAQVQAVNQRLAQAKDVPQIQQQSRLALNGYAAVLEAQVSRFHLASSLGRLPPLERNLQIQQILKQIPGAMPAMPPPQTLPKPVMPPMPMPRRP